MRHCKDTSDLSAGGDKRQRILFFSFSDTPFFFLWFGAAVSLSEILAGTLLAPLGLVRGMIAIIAGHVIGTTLLVLGGAIGTREGVTAIGSAEAGFGRLGKQFFALLNVVQLLGWTAVMLRTGAEQFNHLTRLFWHVNVPSIWVLLLGLLVGIWIMFGRGGIGKLNEAAVALLVGLSLAVFLHVFTSLGSALLSSGSASLRFGSGLDLVIVMPLSWLPLIADYNRYGKGVVSVALSSWLGYVLGSSWMYAIGLVMALAYGGMDLSALASGVAVALAILAVVALSTTTTTFLDAHSAGVSLLNVIPRFAVKWVALIMAAAGTLIALFLPLSEYRGFLYTLGALFSPLYAVVLGRYFVLRRRRYEERLLAWPAVLVWVAGVAFYYAFLGLGTPLGATLPAFVCTGIAYVMLQWVRALGN